MTEHEHHFPVVARWYPARGGGYYQAIVGRCPCVCGRTWAAHVTDPRVNAREALRCVEDHHLGRRR